MGHEGRSVRDIASVLILRRNRAGVYLCLLTGILAGCCGVPTSTKTLAELVASDQPCFVRLDPAWEGKAVDTARTGFFATMPEDAKEQSQRLALRFDRFGRTDDPSGPGFGLGRKTIGEGDCGQSWSNIHTLRSSLPSDDQIIQATSVPALERLLGPAQWGIDAWGSIEEMHSSAEWNCFLLTGPDSMQTLHIFCMITRRQEESEWKVDSMQISRGVARPKEAEHRGT